MSFCTQCGAQLSEGQAFCSNCGAPVAPVQKSNIPPQGENVPPAAENVPPVYENIPPYSGPSAAEQNYNYSSDFNNGAGFFRAPIQNRNIVTCIILTLVTCGIYGLYWYFCIIQDLNEVSENKDSQTPGMVLLLTIVTCGIYGWIWFYNAGERVDALKAKNGESPANYNLIFILLAIFGLSVVNYALIQTELNKVAA